MFNRFLLKGMEGQKRFVFLTYLAQLTGLVLNIIMIFTFANGLYYFLLGEGQLNRVLLSIVGILIARFFVVKASQYFSFRTSLNVKERFRKELYEKVYHLGYGYTNHIASSEVVQLAVEGIEQLDHYYGRFLPQVFYALTAPFVLFAFLAPLNLKIAALLLLFVPIIPIAIGMVQALAKRVVGSYWKSYMNLSDRFLDNMQGLNTLKAYDNDEVANQEMNQEAEDFRKATMRVLMMQINNITIMDIVAYAGAAIGSMASVYAFANGSINFAESLIFILLVVDYFLPLRQLGSFFHIAMNGMAASERLFKILELEDEVRALPRLDEGKVDLRCKDLSFSYDGQKRALKDLNLTFSTGEITALVGRSGCGKSTLASLIMGIYKDFEGELLVQGKPMPIDNDSLMRHLALVDYNAYLFTGTVRHNLLMAKPDATDEEMLLALEKVLLKDFVLSQGGLDMMLLERGQNLSGGQMQRLSLARALLKNADVYILDEATSSIDNESEEIILEVLKRLKKEKTIIFISHRLKSTMIADKIYLLDSGSLKEEGDFNTLLAQKGLFYQMYSEQAELENYAGGEVESCKI